MSSEDDRRESSGRASGERSEPRGGESRTEASAFRPGPSRTGQALTVGAGLLAVLPTALVGSPALVTAGGFLLVLGGLRRRSEGLVGLGAAGLVAGALFAGVLGLLPEATLVATAGALLTYDVADNALSVGEQLGRDAPTASLELVHAAATTLVLAVGGAVAYGVFRLIGGGQPALALLLLVVGAVALSAALR